MGKVVIKTPSEGISSGELAAWQACMPGTKLPMLLRPLIVAKGSKSLSRQIGIISRKKGSLDIIFINCTSKTATDLLAVGRSHRGSSLSWPSTGQEQDVIGNTAWSFRSQGRSFEFYIVVAIQLNPQPKAMSDVISILLCVQQSEVQNQEMQTRCITCPF